MVSLLYTTLSLICALSSNHTPFPVTQSISYGTNCTLAWDINPNTSHPLADEALVLSHQKEELVIHLNKRCHFTDIQWKKEMQTVLNLKTNATDHLSPLPLKRADHKQKQRVLPYMSPEQGWKDSCPALIFSLCFYIVFFLVLREKKKSRQCLPTLEEKIRALNITYLTPYLCTVPEEKSCCYKAVCKRILWESVKGGRYITTSLNEVSIPIIDKQADIFFESFNYQEAINDLNPYFVQPTFLKVKNGKKKGCIMKLIALLTCNCLFNKFSFDITEKLDKFPEIKALTELKAMENKTMYLVCYMIEKEKNVLALCCCPTYKNIGTKGATAKQNETLLLANVHGEA